LGGVSAPSANMGQKVREGSLAAMLRKTARLLETKAQPTRRHRIKRGGEKSIIKLPKKGAGFLVLKKHLEVTKTGGSQRGGQ